jgi:hypothetical protein
MPPADGCEGRARFAEKWIETTRPAQTGAAHWQRSRKTLRFPADGQHCRPWPRRRGRRRNQMVRWCSANGCANPGAMRISVIEGSIRTRLQPDCAATTARRAVLVHIRRGRCCLADDMGSKRPFRLAHCSQLARNDQQKAGAFSSLRRLRCWPIGADRAPWFNWTFSLPIRRNPPSRRGSR